MKKFGRGKQVSLAAARVCMESLDQRLLLSVTYHDGPLLQNVQVENVFMGSAWTQDAALNQQAGDINGFMQYIVDSPYMDLIQEYGVGRGQLVNSVATSGASPRYVDNSTIIQTLDNMIGNGQVGPNNSNKLYFVFTPPDAVVTAGRSNSVNDFLGYHTMFTRNDNTPVYYAVIPYPSGRNATISGETPFEQITQVSTHELAEAVTDPDVQSGWFDNRRQNAGEIGDLANGQAGTLNGYTVQAEYLNSAGQGVLPKEVSTPTQLPPVTTDITQSTEYLSKEVSQYYQQFLRRTGGADEVAYWVGQIQGGVKDQAVLGFILGSEEYFQGSGGTNDAWIDQSYNDVLGRAPDQQGKNGFLQALQQGAARSDVAAILVNSSERQSVLVSRGYNTLLLRDPGPGETDYWAGQINNGLTYEQFTASLASSAEYYNKTSNTPQGWLSSVYADLLGRTLEGIDFQTWADRIPGAESPDMDQISVLPPQLVYHGGPVLQTPRVVAIFLGDAWQNDANLLVQQQQMDEFFQTIVTGPYMDLLNEYNVGRGQYLGSITDNIPVTSDLDDLDVEGELQYLVNNDFVAAPDGNTLYYIFTPPGIHIISNYDTSETDYLGYHTLTTDAQDRPLYYAVVPHPQGNLNLSDEGFTDLDQLTYVSSNLLAGTTTDPDLETGWWDENQGEFGEAGDVVDGQYDFTGGFAVQAVWSNQAQAAVLPSDVTRPEELPGVAGALTSSSEYQRNLVSGYYQQFLGRTPDTQELDPLVALNASDEQYIAGFVGSEEYFQAHGGSNSAWVDALYQDLLGRAPDQAGKNDWLNQLANGASRNTIAYGIAASAEREGNVVRQDYQQYLNRAPAQSEVDSWVSQYQAGLRNEDIIAQFVGSDEYYDRHSNTAQAWLSSAYQDTLGRNTNGGDVLDWASIIPELQGQNVQQL